MVNAYYLKEENEGLLNKASIIVIPHKVYITIKIVTKNDSNETTFSNILPD